MMTSDTTNTSHAAVGDNDVTWLPAWRLRELVAAKEISPVELTRHFLDRIDRLNPTLNAFITVAHDDALAQAKAAEDAVVRGDDLGPLHGVPLGIKDQFWTRGMRTTAGSLVYDKFIPDEDSVHAARVRAAGGIIVGKTNTSEFALLGRTVNRLCEETRNPWDVSRTSGGSSGGSGSAVSAGMVPIAVASDGGGSTRLPAAYNGVFGMIATSGRVPQHGGFGGGLFTSGVGPMTRDVRDGATLLQVLAGPDDRDPTCLPTAPPDFLARLDEGVAGLRIGFTSDYGYWDSPDGDADFLETARTAALQLGDLGATVDEITLDLEDADIAWRLIAGADRYAGLGERLFGDPATRAKLTPYADVMFGQARDVTGAEYSRALGVRYQAIARLRKLYSQYDLIVTPTTLQPPIEVTPKPAALTQPMPFGYTRYTRLINLVGFPAASMLCGFANGMPVGLHVIAPPEDEITVLRACQAYAANNEWWDQHPTI